MKTSFNGFKSENIHTVDALGLFGLGVLAGKYGSKPAGAAIAWTARLFRSKESNEKHAAESKAKKIAAAQKALEELTKPAPAQSAAQTPVAHHG